MIIQLLLIQFTCSVDFLQHLHCNLLKCILFIFYAYFFSKSTHTFIIFILGIMVSAKKRQDFRIQLQKRARRRAQKKIEYLEDDKNWKEVIRFYCCLIVTVHHR